MRLYYNAKIFVFNKMVGALHQLKKYLTQGNKECNSFRGFSQNLDYALRVIHGPSGKKDVSFLGLLSQLDYFF